MLNTIIISKDLEYAKELLNFLNIKNKNLRIIGILTQIEQLIDCIQKNSVDFIIINMEKLDYKFLMTNEVLYPYLKSTIIISNKCNKLKKELLVYGYVNNMSSFEEIINCVDKLVNCKLIEKYFTYNSKNRIRINGLIERELKYLKIKISYKGITYLMESIYILYNLGQYYECNLEKDIYPIIAQKYHKKVSNIKNNINYAINMLYAECEENILKDYLNEYSLCKISPKKVIFSILNNVKKELEEVKV